MMFFLVEDKSNREKKTFRYILNIIEARKNIEVFFKDIVKI